MDRVFLLAFVLLSFVSSAHAQDAAGQEETADALSSTESESDEATRHRNAGILASNDGDFVLAEQEFRASLAIHFRAENAIALAYALEQLARFGEAITLYERVLQLPPDAQSSTNRETLEGYQRRARQQQATLIVVVQGGAGGQVIVDGVAAGTYSEGQEVAIRVDPGERRVAARFGARESRALVQLRAGEHRDLPLRFAPRPAEVAAAAQPEVEVGVSSQGELDRAGARSNAVYWILGGVVVLAGAVILGLALRSSSTEDSALPVWQALSQPPR